MQLSFTGLVVLGIGIGQSLQAEPLQKLLLEPEVEARILAGFKLDFTLGQYEGDAINDSGGFGDLRAGFMYEGETLGLGAQIGFRRLSFGSIDVSETYGSVYADFANGRFSFGAPLNVLDQVARPDDIAGSPAISRGAVNAATGSFASNARLVFEEEAIGGRFDYKFASGLFLLGSHHEFDDISARSTEIAATYANDIVFAEFGVELVATPIIEETGIFGNIRIDLKQAGLLPGVAGAELSLSAGRPATTVSVGDDGYFQIGGLVDVSERWGLGVQVADLGSFGKAQGIFLDYEIVDAVTARISYASLDDESITSFEINISELSPKSEPVREPRRR